MAGSSAALYIALSSCLKEGDEIILWEPSYSNHYGMLREMGIKMQIPELPREKKYHMDLDKLSNYVTKKTKAVLVCNPNNPTGSVYTKKEIEAVGDLAEDHDLTIHQRRDLPPLRLRQQQVRGAEHHREPEGEDDQHHELQQDVQHDGLETRIRHRPREARPEDDSR